MESFLSSKDLTGLLLNKLPLKDVYNFSQIVTNHKDFIYQRTILEIRKRLKEIFQDNLDEFLNLLQQTGAIISGSFILQCILNEYWESDIDIYFPIQDNEIKETPSQNPTSEIDDFLYKSRMQMTGYFAANRYGSDVDLKIKWIRNYKKLDEDKFYKSYKHFSRSEIEKMGENNKYTFQTILVDINKSEMQNFIVNTFDFDICKNIFDGNTLYIHNIKDIVERKTQFKYSYRIQSSLLRCKKYEGRGFEIIGKNIPYSEILENYHEDLARKNKAGYYPYVEIKVQDIKNTDKFKDCSLDCVLKLAHPEDKHYHIYGDHPSENIAIIPTKIYY